MTIDEQLNIFETQLENFVPETPTEKKLLKEASASLSAFRDTLRVYTENKKVWEAFIDHRRRLEGENEGSYPEWKDEEEKARLREARFNDELNLILHELEILRQGMSDEDDEGEAWKNA